MNAHTPAPAQVQALFPGIPAAPPALLTRLDVSDIENVREARHRLRACVTEADYANWAAAWGENLCARAEDFAGADMGDETALEEAEADATRAEKDLEELEAVVTKAVRALDRAADGPDDQLRTEIENVNAMLENAL